MTTNDSATIPRLRLGLLLWLAGMLGVVVVTVTVLPQLLGEVPLPAPLWVISLASFAQSAFLVGLAVWSGVALAPKVGLRAPAFEAAVTGRSIGSALRPQLLPGLVAGVLGGVGLFAIGGYASPAALAEVRQRFTLPNFSGLAPARWTAACVWPVSLLVLVVLTGCPGRGSDEGAPSSMTPVGHAWTEADALFRQDPRWLGSDGAYSIPLGGERTLWLFGDTFVATSDAHRRDESLMISNTIALQDGLDPLRATMRFFWREPNPALRRAELRPREAGLGPQAFLPDHGEIRYWPAHGFADGESLLVFWMRVAPSSEGLGFSIEGTRITLIEMEGDDPRTWPIRDVAFAAPADMVMATMGVAAHDGWLYALSTNEPEHHTFLVRWRLEQAMRGELDAASWWTQEGWSDSASPMPLFEDGAPEGSLHFDAARAEWVCVQSTGFGGADLEVRTAPAPEGPWTARQFFFRPPESDRPHNLVYAGKAHPQLSAGALAVTYAQNADDFDTLVRDDAIYWPRFVLLSWK